MTSLTISSGTHQRSGTRRKATFRRRLKRRSSLKTMRKKKLQDQRNTSKRILNHQPSQQRKEQESQSQLKRRRKRRRRSTRATTRISHQKEATTKSRLKTALSLRLQPTTLQREPPKPRSKKLPSQCPRKKNRKRCSWMKTAMTTNPSKGL